MSETSRSSDNRATPGRVWSVLALVLACLLVIAPDAKAETTTSKEYLVKAAFLLNFAQFVEWPDDAFPAADTPMRIGVLGEDPFGAALDEMTRGETVRNRPVVVRRSRKCDELRDCQLVFISRSEKARIPDILASLAQGAALTVSDIEGTASQGGMIGFYLEGNKVRFELNPTSAQKQRLKLSAQLLRLGRIIGPLPGAAP